MSLCDHTPIINVLAYRPASEADRKSKIRDMWYDWFCKDESLVNKGERLISKLRAITPSPRFDSTKTYAFFKNNCPMNGPLYDDFRICDIETGDVLYCVVPRDSHQGGKASVWGHDPADGEFKQLIVGSWRDVKAFFRESDEAKVQAMIDVTKMLTTIAEAEHENFVFDHKRREEQREYVEQLAYLLDVPSWTI